jgi:hypothetical protein
MFLLLSYWYAHFTVITSFCIAQYMLYRGSDSFAGTTPNMQLIEELQADRERMKEMQERLKRIEEADQERAKADWERFDRIEEHLKQREQADIEREKEIARRDRVVVEAYKSLQEAAAASKKSFPWVCRNRGNWQLAKLKIIWVLTGHCLWVV